MQSKLRPENLILPKIRNSIPTQIRKKRQRPLIAKLGITVGSHLSPLLDNYKCSTKLSSRTRLPWSEFREGRFLRVRDLLFLRSTCSNAVTPAATRVPLNNFSSSTPRKAHANSPVVIVASNAHHRPTPYSGCRTLRPSIGSPCPPRFIADAQTMVSSKPPPALWRTHRRAEIPPHRRVNSSAHTNTPGRLIPPRLPISAIDPRHVSPTRLVSRKNLDGSEPASAARFPKHRRYTARGQRQRLPRASCHVHQPPLLFDPFLFIDRPAVRANPVLHPVKNTWSNSSPSCCAA